MKTVVLIVAVCFATVSIVRGDHVDDVITAQMKEREIPGVALAVIHGGEIVREQGYGYCDETQTERITLETLFQAASVSKPVAALGALHLV